MVFSFLSCFQYGQNLEVTNSSVKSFKEMLEEQAMEINLAHVLPHSNNSKDVMVTKEQTPTKKIPNASPKKRKQDLAHSDKYKRPRHQVPSANSVKDCVDKLSALVEDIQEALTFEENESAFLDRLNIDGENRLIISSSAYCELMPLLQSLADASAISELDTDILGFLSYRSFDALSLMVHYNLLSALERDLKDDIEMTSKRINQILKRINGAVAACCICLMLNGHDSNFNAKGSLGIDPNLLDTVLKFLKNQISCTLELLLKGVSLSQEDLKQIENGDWQIIVWEWVHEKPDYFEDQIVFNFIGFMTRAFNDLSKVMRSKQMPNLDESQMTSIVYICLTPFTEMTIPETYSRLAFIAPLLDQFSYQVMVLLQFVFQQQKNHQIFILDELVTALAHYPPLMQMSNAKKCPSHIKNAPGFNSYWGVVGLTYTLHMGKEISLWSALILGLLQASFGDGKNLFAIVGQVSGNDAASLDSKIEDQLRTETKEVQSALGPLNVAIQSARGAFSRLCTHLVHRLISRCTKKPSSNIDGADLDKDVSSSNSVSNVYRFILEGLITDCFTMMYDLNWPASSEFLNIASLMLLDRCETKPGQQKESYVSRMISIELLTGIAYNVKNTISSLQDFLDKSDSNSDEDFLQKLRQLNDGQNGVRGYSSEDLFERLNLLEVTLKFLPGLNGNKSMKSSTSMFWVINSAYHALKEAERFNIAHEAILQKLTVIIELLALLVDDDTTSFPAALRLSVPDDYSVSIAGLMAHQQQWIFSQQFGESVLLNLLQQSNHVQASVRTKTVRMIGSLVNQDKTILQNASIERCLNMRIMDQSSAVREAAIELLGHHAFNGSAELRDRYYALVANRVLVRHLFYRSLIQVCN